MKRLNLEYFRSGNSKEEARLNKIFGSIAVVVLVTAVWITLTDRWIAPNINVWQTKLTNDTHFYPALTIALLVLPVLLVLLPVKFLLLKRIRRKK